MVDVEFIVYRFGERAANTADFHEVVDARADDTLEPAKLSQQLATPLGAESRNLLER